MGSPLIDRAISGLRKCYGLDRKEDGSGKWASDVGYLIPNDDVCTGVCVVGLYKDAQQGRRESW